MSKMLLIDILNAFYKFQQNFNKIELNLMYQIGLSGLKQIYILFILNTFYTYIAV